MPRPRTNQPTYSLALRKSRYYVQWWEADAARRISCRTGQLAAARRFLAEFEAGRGTPAPPEAPTVATVLDGYQAERELKPCSPTLGNNTVWLKSILGDLPADMLTKERVRHYLAMRRKAGVGGAPAAYRKKPKPLADATLRREVSTLKAAMKWAHHEGWITTVPHIEAPGQSNPRDRWLTRPEAAKLLASARQLHVRVFLALALYTAGRTGALLNLTWDRVDFTGNVVDLGTGRGNKKRASVPLHPSLRPVLLEAMEARTSSHVIEHGGVPIASVKTGFHNAAGRAKVAGVTPHVLRHTAATWMAQQGVSLERIAAYLGNSVATVERVYAHHTPEYMTHASAALGEIS